MSCTTDGSLEKDSLAESSIEMKASSVCECHSTGPRPQPGLTALQRYLPMLLSTLALVFSASTFIYMYLALNSSCTPCTQLSVASLSPAESAGPPPDRPSHDQLRSPQPSRQVEQDVTQKMLHKTSDNTTSESLRNSRSAKDTQKRKNGGGKKRHKPGKPKPRGGRKKKEHRVIAAHFVPMDASKLGYESGGANCMDFGGKTKICKNYTAIQTDKHVKADFWQMSSKKVKKPAVELTDGKFVTVRKSGQYLIYSQAQFLGCKYRTALQVSINGLPFMRCTESAIEDSRKPTGDSYQSCGVSGVFTLEAKDKVEIIFPYQDTQIDLKNDTTFFGMVYLSK